MSENTNTPNGGSNANVYQKDNDFALTCSFIYETEREKSQENEEETSGASGSTSFFHTDKSEYAVLEDFGLRLENVMSAPVVTPGKGEYAKIKAEKMAASEKAKKEMEAKEAEEKEKKDKDKNNNGIDDSLEK